MRRIFDAITKNSGRSASNSISGDDFGYNQSNAPSPIQIKKDESPKSTGIRSRGFLSRASKLESKFSNIEDGKSISMILLSAQRLKIMIDEILNDASGLAGDNVAGFEQLIEILDSDMITIADGNHHQQHHNGGYGSLTALISNRNHHKFIESCNSCDLANSLFNVLRLLRMYEIKQAKLLPSNRESKTYPTMARVMVVFSTLLESSQTVEQLRPSLVKLFVFPLSPLPLNAIHFQSMSAELISLICKSGISSQIVWFLHDQQAMHHMARQLSELTSLEYLNITSSESSKSSSMNDVTLRGYDAEKAGMWLTAMRCVVDVITASVTVSPVLMVDFERAGGYKTIVHILEYCSSHHSMDAMNTTMRLFFDPSLKTDEPLSFPDVGVILSDILISCLGLKRRINDDDSLEKLVAISQHLQYQNNIKGREYLLQSFAYALLTIYSNDPRNCNILEEHFHYLPTLMISLPALCKSDTISAILTTLNYVCQCVETAAIIPLVALCAASTTTVSTAVSSSYNDHDDVDPIIIDRAIMQFHLMYSSYDAIIRSNGKYAMVLVNSGWLKYMIYDPFLLLSTSIQQHQHHHIHPKIFIIYERLIDLMICCDRRSPAVANEISSCGILSIISDFISNDDIPPSFTRKLLTIHESLCLSSDHHQQQYCVSLILQKLAGFMLSSPTKSICMIEALRDMILSSEHVTSICFSYDAVQVLLNIVASLKGAFSSSSSSSSVSSSSSSPVSSYDMETQDHYFYLLGSISKYFASLLLISYPHIYDDHYHERLYYYHNFYQSYTYHLYHTNIFSNDRFDTSSLNLIMILIHGDVHHSRIETPSAIIALMIIIPHLNDKLRNVALYDHLHPMIDDDAQGSQLLAQHGIISYIINKYFGRSSYHDNDVSHDINIYKYDALKILHKHMPRYLRTEDLIIYLRDVVRPAFIPTLSSSTPSSSSYKHLLPPWISYHQAFDELQWWQYISPLLSYDDSNNNIIHHHHGVPYLALGSSSLPSPPSSSSYHPSYLNLIISENIATFLMTGFTFSTWIQLPNTSSDTFSGMITIFSMTSTPSSSSGCFLEVQLCCHNFEVLVIFRHHHNNIHHHMSTLKFKAMISCHHASWTLITFAYKRGKRFAIMGKSSVNVYLNGIASEAVDIDNIDTDIPSSHHNTAIEIIIGKSYIDSIQASSSLSYDVPRWNLGPFIFFEEIISQSQVGVMHMKGPSYTGNYQGISLSESSATISSYMLSSYMTSSSLTQSSSSSSSRSCEAYLDMIGFKGIEHIIDPSSSSSSSSEGKYELASLPKPLLLFSADHIHHISSRHASSLSDIHHHKGYDIKTIIGENILYRYDDISLYNSAGIDCDAVIAHVHHHPRIMMNESFATAISSLGGPSILFPILQYASSSSQVCHALTMIHHSIKHNIYNIKYMKKSGYKVISFILSLKPDHIYDINVFDMMLEFSIDRSYDDKISSDDVIPKHHHMLLVDTSSFYHMIMNHHVWDARRYSFVMRLLEHLLALVRDARYAYLNTCRLSSLNITSWLLHLCTYGIEQHHINASFSSSASSSSSMNDTWSIRCSSDEELSYYNDDKDPFFQAIINLLLRIIAVDIKVRDLDIIAQIISMTFTPDIMRPTMILSSSSSSSSEKRISNDIILSPPRNRPNPSSSSSSKISSYIQLRVYLLRLLYQLCENIAFGSNLSSSSSSSSKKQPSSSSSSSAGNISSSISSIAKIFRLESIINIMEMADDVSTKTYALRLLGLFIQIDTSSYHDFCNKRVPKRLESILSSSSSSSSGMMMYDSHMLPLLVPLIAISYKIPFQVLPYAFQVTSADKLLQLCELEECRGPDCSDIEGIRYTLPMISLLLSIIISPRSSSSSSMTSSSSSSSSIWHMQMIIDDNIINDIIMKFMSYYYLNNVAYRQLLQHRYAVDMITSALLSSSNAVDDYGSYIYYQPSSSTSSSDDITMMIHDDYIPSSSASYMIESIRICDDHHNIINNNDMMTHDKTIILKGEGPALLKLLASIIDSAYKEFHNISIISHIMISFPMNMDDTYTYAYQHMIFNEIKNIIDYMMMKSFGSKVMMIIINSITMMMPLIKTRIIHDHILSSILSLLYDLLDHFQEQRSSHAKYDELYSPLIKEVIMTSRYIASIIIFSVSTSLSSTSSSASYDDMMLNMMMMIRKNIIKLIPKGYDESYDVYNNISKHHKQMMIDDKNTSSSCINVLESYQLMMISYDHMIISGTNKKLSSTDILSSCIIERNKLSNIFIATISLSCFNLSSYHHKDIIVESCRIISLLSLHRRNIMRSLYSSSSDHVSSSSMMLSRATSSLTASSIDDVDIYDDGIMILLPSSSSSSTSSSSTSSALASTYVSYLQYLNDDNTGEDQRMHNYMIWYDHNSAQLYRHIRPLEHHIRSYIPSYHDSIRQIQTIRIKDHPSSSTSSSSSSSSSMIDITRQSYKICISLKTWKMRGISSLSSAIILWRAIYDHLQSGVVWGYHDIRDDPPITSQWNDDMIHASSSSIQSSSSSLSSHIDDMRGSKLDVAEGPERMRRKLEQDYDVYREKAWTQLVAETNKKIEQAMMKHNDASSSSHDEHDDDKHDDMMMTPIRSSMIPSSSTSSSTSSSPRKSVLGSILKTPKWRHKSMSAAMFSSQIKSSSSSSGIIDDHHMMKHDMMMSYDDDMVPDMMEFVKEMSKQGIIKRMDDDNANALSYYDNIVDSSIDAVLDQRILNSSSSSSSSAVVKTNDKHDDHLLNDDVDDVVDDASYHNNDIESPSPSYSRKDSISIEPSYTIITASSSSYNRQSIDINKSMIIEEVLRGLVGMSDYSTGEMYNIDRISGLESSRGVMIITDHHIYMINGIVMKNKDIDDPSSSSSSSVRGKSRQYDNKSYHTTSSSSSERAFEWLLDSTSLPDIIDSDSMMIWLASIWKEMLSSDIAYSKTSFTEIYSVFKRRHHLKYTALEYTDTNGYSILFSCNTVDEANTILSKFFTSSSPPIIFRNINSFKNLPAFLGINHAYKMMISQYLHNLTKIWTNGEITNFEYIIQLNSVAGRSYLDLTQYPVFPWVIADYTSSTIDLTNPTIYRDLSRPMGALGLKRSYQFKERYKSMDEFQKDDNGPPPFHYGTHYSCAGYVLYYLMRLPPYSDEAICLQGGQFDIADRLFLSIESSWRSASSENLQDVRELIPEFYYLPEFLLNSQKYNFGTTQRGQIVNDVELPLWAHNDPVLFIKIMREALESKYVSERIHEWIDLIFGYKQRGIAAENAMNMFIHVTYEGEVDIDAISDPIMQLATIAQINNFGQTPSMLFSKPHPKRIIPDVIIKKSNNINIYDSSNISIDSSALSWHSHIHPPLTIVGASYISIMNRISYQQVLVHDIPSSSSSSSSLYDNVMIHDISFSFNNKLIAAPRGSVYLPPTSKRMIRYEGLSGGIIINPVLAAALPREQEKDVSIFDRLHAKEITCISISQTGDTFVTGSKDTSLRLWSLTAKSNRDVTIDHIHTYTGHSAAISCVDYNHDFSIIASGSDDSDIIIWDARTGKLRYIIQHHHSRIISISINNSNGHIISISSSYLHISSINGDMISYTRFDDHVSDNIIIPHPSIVLAPAVHEWQDGVVAVTGHQQGYVYFWKLSSSSSSSPPSISSSSSKLMISYHLPKCHRASISCMKMMSGGPMHTNRIKDFVERTFDDSISLEFYVGDEDGHVSRYNVQRLDQLSQVDLQSVLSSSS